ncbi:MAG: cytochrome P450 [Prochlorothrix sp.]|nr:cytochrome P450 [Prochlorothrix sp.]
MTTPSSSSSALPLPPGQFGLPIVGETLDFFRDPLFAQKRHDRYGDIFKTRLLGQPTIFMRGAEANRFILTQEHRAFQATWPESVRILLGSKSLATQTGETHLNRRKLMGQAFQPRALSSYAPTLEALTQHYCQRWQQQQEFAWYPELRHYTFDVACKLFIGLDQSAETPLCEAFETWCQGLFTLPINLPWTRFGQAMQARHLLMTDLETFIHQRQAAQGNTPPSHTKTETSGQDALDLLLHAQDESGQTLSLAELKDQILLLLFAGHETLTSSVTSLVMLLAQHPEVLAKARAEQEVFRGQPLTPEVLKQMTYLDQVMQETLRLIAPVGGGFRKTITDCEYQGYRVPAGWTVNYQITATHKDDRLYPDPDRFDPDRFSPDRQDAKQPFAHLPFGGGMRECIGKEFARLEIKILGALLLQGYQWEILPDQDLSQVVIPSPRPRDGLRVKFSALSSR